MHTLRAYVLECAAATAFQNTDVRIAGRACRDFGFMRKMRTWSHSSVSDATDERFAETAWSIVIAAGASDSGACAHGNGGVMPNLLATHLRLPAPQWPLEARRRGFNAIIFSAPVGKRDAPARFAREGALPQFPPRSAEALPGGRAHAAAYLETRRPEYNSSRRTNSRPRSSITCARIVKRRRMKSSMPVGRAWCWSARSTRSAQNAPRKARRISSKRCRLFSEE